MVAPQVETQDYKATVTIFLGPFRFVQKVRQIDPVSGDLALKMNGLDAWYGPNVQGWVKGVAKPPIYVGPINVPTFPTPLGSDVLSGVTIHLARNNIYTEVRVGVNPWGAK